MSYRKVLRASTNVSVASNYQHRDAPRKAPPSTPAPKAAVNGGASPPKPPRSAFMCFTDAKKKEIMGQQGIVHENDDILKIVAKEWRILSDKERGHWDEEARKDKFRYVQEKASYKGPHMITKRRAKKHPMAPKRPMSAFLKFSQTRRPLVKRDNPDMSNTDVSRLLGEMWRNASPKEQAPYREEELRERAVYKVDIKRFNEEQARKDAASRTSHQSVQGSYSHHHSHHHHSQEYRRSPYPNSITNTFDTLRIDSFEEPSTNNSKPPAPFRPQYYNSYQPYRQTYPAVTDSLQHSTDFHDDPFTVVSRAPPPLPPHPLDDEEPIGGQPIGGHYSASRSSYFSDSMSLGGGYYSRYP